MKVQSTFYPNFISKTVALLIISSCITKNVQIIDIWCIYGFNSREKMSQITHFCGVNFLACKSGSVNFLTNIMSVTYAGLSKLGRMNGWIFSNEQLSKYVMFAMEPFWSCSRSQSLSLTNVKTFLAHKTKSKTC